MYPIGLLSGCLSVQIYRSLHARQEQGGREDLIGSDLSEDAGSDVVGSGGGGGAHVDMGIEACGSAGVL